MKNAEAAQIRDEILPTVRNTSVVALDDDDDAGLGLHMVEGQISMYWTADFEASFNVAGALSRKAANNLKRKGKKEMYDTQEDWGGFGESGQPNGRCNVILVHRSEILCCALHAVQKMLLSLRVYCAGA